MSPFAEVLTIVRAIGAATAAGTFFTFSTFTIAGLRRLEEWVRMNHVRTIVPLVSAVLLVLSLVR